MEQPKGAARAAAGAPGTRCQIDIDGKGGYGWRLIASNGRPVAVTRISYDSHALCRGAFIALCAGHDRYTGGIQHSAGGGGWIWVLRDESGAAVAASPRTYERHATCRSAYDRFRAMLPELTPEQGALWGEA